MQEEERAKEPEPQQNGTPKTLDQLVQLADWEKVQVHCQEQPEDLKLVDPTTGGTVLHRLCATAQVPLDVFQQVVELNPDAVRIQEKVYQATPLHILSWRSQRATQQVSVLLHHMTEKDLHLRNSMGGTPLHSACGSQASLEVIQQIINKDPSVVVERTYDYNFTALTALWHSHLQSIPGHMQIARILKGEQVDEAHFERFWEKVELLARVSYKESSSCAGGVIQDASEYVLHGLIHLRAPLNALKVALKRNPSWAAVADDNGNYPLHHILIRRPFRVKDIEVITELLAAHPEAGRKKNKAGDTPIFIAVKDRMAWEEGLGEIVKASPEILSTVDPQTGVYPFLLAASFGGKVAVNTTFQLLSAAPHLVKGAMS